MTEPNKFEQAARLVKALEKSEARHKQRVAKSAAKWAEECAELRALAGPEVRKMVEGRE